MGRAINGILGYPTPASLQDLDTFWQGEDIILTFTLTSSITPDNWLNVEFTLIPEGQPQQGRFTTSLIGGGVTITNISTTTPFTATVSVTLPAAKTAGMGAGSAVWQCLWADSGNVSELGSGEIPIMTPIVPIP